jgi:hypothetical protein
MRTLILVLAAILSCALLLPFLVGQPAATYKIPVWIGSHYIYPTVGVGFNITTGTNPTISVFPTSQKVRKYNVVIVLDIGTRRIPDANPANVVIHLNGLRQLPGTDYSLSGQLITPLWEWPQDAGTIVLADYDLP